MSGCNGILYPGYSSYFWLSLLFMANLAGLFQAACGFSARPNNFGDLKDGFWILRNYPCQGTFRCEFRTALPASVLSGLALKSASLLLEGALSKRVMFPSPIRINNLPRLNTRPKFDAHLQQQKISFIFSNPPTPSIRLASDLSSGFYILSLVRGVARLSRLVTG